MNGVGMLERTLAVLGSFSEDEPELTAAELAVSTGLPSSTLHRLLGTLIGHGLMTRVPGHRYTVGSKLWELGELSPLSMRLRERAIPHLLRLYEATGENAYLGVLEGEPDAAAVLYVARVTGRNSVPTIGRAGGRGPLHATGVGRVLLAGRDEDWLLRYFRVPRERETMMSLTGEAELRREIARTRARGYALTREEMTLGSMSVAAPIPCAPGLPPAALSIVARKDQADEKMLARLVLLAARDIGAACRDD